MQENQQKQIGLVKSLYKLGADTLCSLWRIAKKYPYKSLFLVVIIFSIYPPYSYHKRKTGEFDFGKYFDDINLVNNHSSLKPYSYKFTRIIEGQIKQDILKKYPIGSGYLKLHQALIQSNLIIDNLVNKVQTQIWLNDKKMPDVIDINQPIGFETRNFLYVLIGNFISGEIAYRRINIKIYINKKGRIKKIDSDYIQGIL